MRTQAGVEKVFVVVGLLGAAIVAGGAAAIASGSTALGAFGVGVGVLDLYAGWTVTRHLRQRRDRASDELREPG